MDKTIKISELPEFDATRYLEDEQDIAMYLTCVLEENDAALLAAALGDIAKARGMTEVAKKAGITREGLYKALSADGNPSFGTVLKVADAMGYQFALVGKAKPKATKRVLTKPTGTIAKPRVRTVRAT